MSCGHEFIEVDFSVVIDVQGENQGVPVWLMCNVLLSFAQDEITALFKFIHTQESIVIQIDMFKELS